MKSRILFCIVFFAWRFTIAQLEGGVEQYTFIKKNEPTSFVPIVHIQNKNWYSEARYNYEEQKTFSVYIGKIFSGEEPTHSYSIIPVVGVVFGEFKGGSVGLDVTFNDHDFFFCSQSQYTFSNNDHYQNFLYSWSELGYEPSKWFYAGLALQHIQLFKITEETIGYDFGAMAGLKLGPFTIPFYSFSPLSDKRYFIVGLTLGFGKSNTLHIR